MEKLDIGYDGFIQAINLDTPDKAMNYEPAIKAWDNARIATFTGFKDKLCYKDKDGRAPICWRYEFMQAFRYHLLKQLPDMPSLEAQLALVGNADRWARYTAEDLEDWTEDEDAVKRWREDRV